VERRSRGLLETTAYRAVSQKDNQLARRQPVNGRRDGRYEINSEEVRSVGRCGLDVRQLSPAVGLRLRLVVRSTLNQFYRRRTDLSTDGQTGKRADLAGASRPRR